MFVLLKPCTVQLCKNVSLYPVWPSNSPLFGVDAKRYIWHSIGVVTAVFTTFKFKLLVTLQLSYLGYLAVKSRYSVKTDHSKIAMTSSLGLDLQSQISRIMLIFFNLAEK